MAKWMARLGRQEPPLGLRDGASEFPSGLQPFSDHDFGIGKGLLPREAVSRAAGELRHLGDKCIIFLTPVENNLCIFVTWPLLSVYAELGLFAPA